MASSRHAVYTTAFRGIVEVHGATPGGADRSLFGLDHPHARLCDGRTVVWRPSPTVGHTVVALDAESVDTPIPPHVAARLPDAAQVDPVAAWTRLEVAAKLTGTPVLLLLTGAIPAPHLDIVTTSVDDIVVSMGRSADDAATSH